MGRVAAYLALCVLSSVVAHRGAAPGQGPLLRMLQLVDVVDQLKSVVSDLGPAALPAPRDVKRHCEWAAFSCFQKVQLRAAQPGASAKMIHVLSRQLRRRLPPEGAGRRRGPRTTCPSCDSYEKKPPGEFLERLKSLLQKMIQQHL